MHFNLRNCTLLWCPSNISVQGCWYSSTNWPTQKLISAVRITERMANGEYPYSDTSNRFSVPVTVTYLSIEVDKWATKTDVLLITLYIATPADSNKLAYEPAIVKSVILNRAYVLCGATIFKIHDQDLSLLFPQPVLFLTYNTCVGVNMCGALSLCEL